MQLGPAINLVQLAIYHNVTKTRPVIHKPKARHVPRIARNACSPHKAPHATWRERLATWGWVHLLGATGTCNKFNTACLIPTKLQRQDQYYISLQHEISQGPLGTLAELIELSMRLEESGWQSLDSTYGFISLPWWAWALSDKCRSLRYGMVHTWYLFWGLSGQSTYNKHITIGSHTAVASNTTAMTNVR